MRILGAEFVQRYEGRMLNIHPSLLPAYPGTDTHRRALADGARDTAAPCISSRPTSTADRSSRRPKCRCCPATTPASLAARVLEQEHRLLPEVVGWFCEGRIVLDDGRVRVIASSQR